jgi:GTP-binding protein YchF
MEIGIIGFPQSGKTTVFNTVTRGHAAVAGYSQTPNVGIAKVPDARLDALAAMYKPRRVVPAEISYTDIPPPPEGFGKNRGIGGEYLNALQSMDALLIVVRDFVNPSVVHIDDNINPYRDIENLLTEIVFSDLEILERRISRLQGGLKGAKPHEREAFNKEMAFLEDLRPDLENGLPLREQNFDGDPARWLGGYGMLSLKPLIVVVNTGEDKLDDIEQLESEIATTIAEKRIRVIATCAQIEMELGQLEEKAAEDEMRAALGVGESTLDRMVRLSYDVVGRISFFTVGEDEVRAWEISQGTAAQKGAGRIHSDLERGFIRAEVISYESLISCGSLSEGRKQGLLRQEGKGYIVQDGDIMHVLFNV